MAAEPQYFDLEEEFTRIAGEVGLIRNDGGWSLPGDPSNALGFDGFIPPATFGGDHPRGPDQNQLPVRQTTNGLLTPMLGFPFGPFEFGGDMWADPGSFASGSPSARYLQDLPPAPGPMTTTFPPRDPWHDHLDYFSGGNGYEETLAQEAEASTSLAPTKPSYIENNNQSGQSSSAPSPSSRGGYDRAQSKVAKAQCLIQICSALGIPPTKPANEMDTLRRIVRHLGATIAEPAPAGRLSKGDRIARNREERRKCFEAMKEFACPWMTKIRELVILQNVLTKVTSHGGESQGADARDQHYTVFRAW